MEKIISITLKLNFTSNTLGCMGEPPKFFLETFQDLR